MNSFKYFNRFLVAGLLLAGQMPNVQAIHRQKELNQTIATFNQLQDLNGGVLSLKGHKIKPEDLRGILKLIDHPEKITTLNLNNNDFDRFPNDVNDLLLKLERLDLDENRLHIHPETLKYIPESVTYLSLKAQKKLPNDTQTILQFPEEIIKRFGKLQTLNLSDISSGSPRSHETADLVLNPSHLKHLLNCKTISLYFTPLEKEIQTLVKNGFKSKNNREETILHFLENFFNSEEKSFDVNIHCLDTMEHINIKTFATLYHNTTEKAQEIAQLYQEISGLKAMINNQNDEIKQLLNMISEEGAQ